MTKYFFFALITLALFTGVDCKNDKDIVDPPPVDDIQPGKRDYVWTVDTLYTKPGDIIYAVWRIWGSSPDNVWMIASADAGYQLWHYDGKKWTRDSTLFQISPSALYGFSKNDVWMSSRSTGANFWHYDGNKWSFYNEKIISNYDLTYIDDIWGDRPDNIFATGAAEKRNGGGYKGILMHFDGSAWNEVKLPDTRVQFQYIRKSSDNIYFFINAARYESTGDTLKIFTYKDGILTELLKNQFLIQVIALNKKIYININKKIYSVDNNLNLNLWKDFTETDFLGSIQGRTEKDFFSIGKKGLMHYNGTNFVTIYSASYFITGFAIFERDIFFGVDDYTTGRHIMVRGTLKE